MDAQEIKVAMIGKGVRDVSSDLLSKALKSLIEEELLRKENNGFVITETGEKQLVCDYKNMEEFFAFLTNEQKDETFPLSEELLNDLNNIKGLKTIPYNVSRLGLSEDDFFFGKMDSHSPYHFKGRGFGKTQIPACNLFDYSQHVALFMNSGSIRFFAFIKSYDDIRKNLELSRVIKLTNPITTLDIREHVRENFNISQQKQEFFQVEEVKAFIELLKVHCEKGFVSKP